MSPCLLLCQQIIYLVAQMVNNLSVMQETWVSSLDLEDPLEKGMATHSTILFMCVFKYSSIEME